MRSSRSDRLLGVQRWQSVHRRAVLLCGLAAYAVALPVPAHGQLNLSSNVPPCEKTAEGCASPSSDPRAQEADKQREREIDAFTNKYGDHRRAEAEKLRKMREAAGHPAPTSPPPSCQTVNYSSNQMAWGNVREAAMPKSPGATCEWAGAATCTSERIVTKVDQKCFERGSACDPYSYGEKWTCSRPTICKKQQCAPTGPAGASRQ